MKHFSGTEWSGMIALAESLSVAGLTEDLHTACFFDQFISPTVVVIGLVNRGKSTLVNELIGESLAPQAFTPETATLLGISNCSDLRPYGFTKSGSTRILPSDPKRFSKRLKRGSKTQMASAFFPLAVNLPKNLVLIDTPGIEEVESSANAAALVHATKRAMEYASGAIVVLGVPGIKGSDVRLVRESIETFGRDKTMIVIKANDSSVSIGDVQAWRDELGFDSGYKIALLADSDKSQLAVLGSFLHEISRLKFSESKYEESVYELTELLLASISESQPLRVEARVKRQVPESIREVLLEATQRRVKARLKKELREKKRQKKFQEKQLRRSFAEAVIEWKSRDAILQERIQAASMKIEQCEEALKEAQRLNDSPSRQLLELGSIAMLMMFQGQFPKLSGAAMRQAQLLQIEQCKSRLDLAKSEMSEAVNAKRHHELERPRWGRWVMEH